VGAVLEQWLGLRFCQLLGWVVSSCHLCCARFRFSGRSYGTTIGRAVCLNWSAVPGYSCDLPASVGRQTGWLRSRDCPVFPPMIRYLLPFRDNAEAHLGALGASVLSGAEGVLRDPGR
jgi:hypothetical protein